MKQLCKKQVCLASEFLARIFHIPERRVRARGALLAFLSECEVPRLEFAQRKSDAR